MADRACLYMHLMQEDEDRVLTRDGLGEGRVGDDIDITKVAPIPAFCSR